MAFTYFFRDEQTLDAIRDTAIKALQGSGHIDIWDAGCAMGPEPYTLAIIVREQVGRFLFRNVRIFASDIDESKHFGTVIADAIYSDEETKRIPEQVLKSHFEPVEGKRFRLVEEIRRTVTFRQHDLLSLEPFRTGFGLVVCKNVLLHFTAEQRCEVIRMFHGVLSAGGFLAMEQTQKLPQEVSHLFTRASPMAQLYQKVPSSAAG